MSFDCGAISNFGALTFPATGGSGGGTGPDLNVSTITLAGQVLPFTYGGYSNTGTAGFQTVTLPFSYIDDNFQIIVQYSDNSGLNVLNTYGLLGIPASISSFQIRSNSLAAAYSTQYITCGYLTNPTPPILLSSSSESTIN